MKKLIALIVTISVMLGMCATAFAATNPVEPEGDAITLNQDGSFTVDAEKVTLLVPEESIDNNSQTTIVVVKGTEINVNSIQYINQSEDTSFTFVPKDDTTYKAGNEAVTLTAYIGGDAITKTTAGLIEYKAAVAPVTKYTVKFVSDGTEISSTEYDEGTVGVTYSGETPTKAADNENTYAFAGWYDSETQADVDLATLTVTKDITLIAKFAATPIQSGGEDEGTDYTVGDVDGDDEITIGDVTTLIDKVLNRIERFTDTVDSSILPFPVGDTDGDSEITIGDVTTTIDKVLNRIENFDTPIYTLPYGTTAESTYPVE